MAQPSSNMAHPTRLPSLQSRDPRTNASRFETDALRHFLTDTLPPSEKSHVIPEEKVPGQRKQSKRKALLRIMKRRPSQPELVSPVSNVEPLPAGTIARTISGYVTTTHDLINEYLPIVQTYCYYDWAQWHLALPFRRHPNSLARHATLGLVFPLQSSAHSCQITSLFDRGGSHSPLEFR